MSGTPQTVPAARRLRVRLVAAVVVLTGLLALSGSQCADGMNAGMHATSSVAILDHGQASGHSDGPGDRGGVLAFCLAMLFLVVVAVAGLRPAWPRVAAVVRASGRGGLIHVVPVRAPSLARLCVLRA